MIYSVLLFILVSLALIFFVIYSVTFHEDNEDYEDYEDNSHKRWFYSRSINKRMLDIQTYNELRLIIYDSDEDNDTDTNKIDSTTT